MFRALSSFRLFSYRLTTLRVWGLAILCSGCFSFCSGSSTTGVRWVKPPPKTVKVGSTVSLEWEVFAPLNTFFIHTNIHTCRAEDNDNCKCIVVAQEQSNCLACCGGAGNCGGDEAKLKMCPRIDSKERKGYPGVFTIDMVLHQKGRWKFLIHAFIKSKDRQSEPIYVTVQ